MSTRILFASLAILLTSSFEPSFASHTGGLPPGVPTIAGRYVYTWDENCGASNGVSQTTGTLTFDPSTSTVTLNAYHVGGGNSLSITPVSGSTTYSNTATKIKIGSQSYYVFYGKVVKGIVTYLSAITLFQTNSGPCGDQFWLSLAG